MLQNAKKQRKLQNILRLAIFICAAFSLLVLIVVQVVERNTWNAITAANRAKQNDLQSIVNYIEFNGFNEQDETLGNMMQQYSAKYHRYSNFVLIDNNFRVVYAQNQGHLDDTGTLYACLDSRQGDLLCILDAEGNIVSSHYVISDDLASLMNLSKPLLPKLEKLEGAAYESGGSASYVTVYGDMAMPGTSASYSYYGYSTGGDSVTYAGFPTKNLHMFFFNDGDNLAAEQSQERERGVQPVVQFFVVSALLAFFAYWLMTAVWVFLDASRRDNNHPALWSILTLCTNVVGLIVYLMVRPEIIQCSECKEPIGKDYVVCPVCGARNREQCEKCGRIVEDAWNICPFCATPVQGRGEGGEPHLPDTIPEA